jgi:MoxR-like ATPase
MNDRAVAAQPPQGRPHGPNGADGPNGLNGAGALSGATEFADIFAAVHNQICRVIKGKAEEVHLALVCVFSEGHLLVEDVPGVGKTTLAKAIARSLGLSWHRAQFTPDMLPSDVTGTSVFDRATSNFIFRPGSVFANILLADEINRASPKTQAALLEAMEERQVTVDTTTYALPEPFVVVATQNPVEHEGTYPLPASELDRFLLRLHVGYPDKAAALEMLQQQASVKPEDLEALVPVDQVRAMARFSTAVHVGPALQSYMVDLAEATRAHPNVTLGLSPRAVLGLQRTSRCLAASRGRDYVVPDDIKALLRPVGEHRLVLSPDFAFSRHSAAHVISEVLTSVPVPLPAPMRGHA